MDMVGHQAVGMDLVTVALAVAMESFEIGLTIGVVEKGPLCLVTPNNDMGEQLKLFLGGLVG
jgi:hypothetical protein